MDEITRMMIEQCGLDEIKTIACGDCFRYAWRWGLDAMNSSRESKTKIVHGTVQGEFDRRRYSHAWVEYNGRVFDWQTQKTKPRGIAIRDFNKMMSPKRASIYTPEQSSVLMPRHGHYGPWE